MKRIVRVVGPSLAVTLAVLVAPAHAGGPLEIEFDDDFFAPSNPPAKILSQLGEEVVWVGPSATSDHNIHQDARLFHSGPPGPIAEYHQDISAGRYHYYCQLHGSKAGGMDGVVRIKPVAVLPDGDSARIIWADDQAEATHRFRVEFRRQGARKWKLWKRATAQIQGEFGDGDEPVNANPSRDYQVRVRTFVKGKPNRRSDWSPVVTFSVSS